MKLPNYKKIITKHYTGKTHYLPYNINNIPLSFAIIIRVTSNINQFGKNDTICEGNILQSQILSFMDLALINNILGKIGVLILDKFSCTCLVGKLCLSSNFKDKDLTVA